MSSIQFGDGSLGAPEAAPAPLDAQQVQPVQPVQPLQPLEPLQPLHTLAPVTPEAPVAAAPAPVAQPTETPATPGLALADMRDVPLGTLVFRAGLLPEEKLEEALQEGIKSGKRLGEILLERGLVSESDLGHLLAGQKGLPFVELDPTAIDPTAPPLLHPEKARLHGALPIGFQSGVPVVAVADPSNDLVVENVRRALNCEPVLVVAGRDALYRAIDFAYGGQAAVTQTVAAPVDAAQTPVVPAVEAQTPVAPEPVAVAEPELPALEPVAPVVEPAPPAIEPVAVPVPEPVVPAVPEPGAPAAETFAPVAEPAPAAPVVPVAPVATQPSSNGEGVWLGEVQEAAPTPVVTPEPVEPVSVPEAEPIQTVQVVEAAPLLQPEPVAAPPVPAVEPEPAAPPEAVAPASSWGVEVRLTNDERIEIGVHPTHEDALEAARAVVVQASASDQGSWPFVAGRFLRPDAIVSVDLVELASYRWLGSSARAAWGEQGRT